MLNPPTGAIGRGRAERRATGDRLCVEDAGCSEPSESNVNESPRGWSLVSRLTALWAWIVVCGGGLGIASAVQPSPGGWEAVLLATMIVAASASAALVVSVVMAQRGDPVTGLLVSVMCRTLVPLGAGVLLSLPGSPPATAEAFGWLVALYLLVLGVEVVLSLPVVD